MKISGRFAFVVEEAPGGGGSHPAGPASRMAAVARGFEKTRTSSSPFWGVTYRSK